MARIGPLPLHTRELQIFPPQCLTKTIDPLIEFFFALHTESAQKVPLIQRNVILIQKVSRIAADRDRRIKDKVCPLSLQKRILPEVLSNGKNGVTQVF